MGRSTAQHMVKSDASNYHCTSANSTKQNSSPTIQDTDTFHVAKICKALFSAENPNISKIDPAVTTKPVTDDTPVCCHSIDACLWLTNISKGSPPPPLMYLNDYEVKGL